MLYSAWKLGFLEEMKMIDLKKIVKQEIIAIWRTKIYGKKVLKLDQN